MCCGCCLGMALELNWNHPHLGRMIFVLWTNECTENLNDSYNKITFVMRHCALLITHWRNDLQIWRQNDDYIHNTINSNLHRRNTLRNWIRHAHFVNHQFQLTLYEKKWENLHVPSSFISSEFWFFQWPWVALGFASNPSTSWSPIVLQKPSDLLFSHTDLVKS